MENFPAQSQIHSGQISGQIVSFHFDRVSFTHKYNPLEKACHCKSKAG